MSTRTGAATRRRRFAKRLHDNATWVAEADGRVAGFVNVIFDETARSGEIYMIAVDPGIQRRGVGSLLTEKAIDEMRARDIDLAIVATGGDPGHAPSAGDIRQGRLHPRSSGLVLEADPVSGTTPRRGRRRTRATTRARWSVARGGSCSTCRC